ncbi:MAG TPA: hypothetical protein ENK15_04400 [Thermopetrobacter sp.]|nr:hypothetical protein [Thermopetrobacter sp.]
MRPLIALAALAALATFAITPAAASCPAGMKTYLNCTAKGGKKRIVLCAGKRGIRYVYGPVRGKPELRLDRPLSAVKHTPWRGVGRSIWEDVRFSNGGYDYTVAISRDRMKLGEPYGAVFVEKGGREVARVECDPGRIKLKLWLFDDLDVK